MFFNLKDYPNVIKQSNFNQIANFKNMYSMGEKLNLLSFDQPTIDEAKYVLNLYCNVSTIDYVINQLKHDKTILENKTFYFHDFTIDYMNKQKNENIKLITSMIKKLTNLDPNNLINLAAIDLNKDIYPLTNEEVYSFLMLNNNDENKDKIEIG